MPESVRFGRAENDKPFRPETSANDPREIIIQPGWNVRDMNSAETREHIDALKASILARANEGLSGLLKPIEVKYDPVTGTKTLVDGHCRLLACRELWNEGHHIYVANVRVKGSDEQLLASSLTGNAGKPLMQWEIGEGCRRLLNGFNWTPAMIAAHICKSTRYVTEAIALVAVPSEAKQMMAKGEVTPARVLQEVKAAEKRNEPASKAVEVLREAVRAAPIPVPKKKSGAPAKPAKPLARAKAESSTEKALRLADELAEMVLDDTQSIDKVMALAKRYMKARGK